MSSHLRLCLPKGIFPVGVPVNILKALLPSLILATWPAHLNLLDYSAKNTQENVLSLEPAILVVGCQISFIKCMIRAGYHTSIKIMTLEWDLPRVILVSFILHEPWTQSQWRLHIKYLSNPSVPLGAQGFYKYKEIQTKFIDKINLPLFSTVLPSNSRLFLSCRPFIVITFSTGLMGELSTDQARRQK